MMTTPRSRSTDQRYYGVWEGLVTDVNDPEKLGRVKLKIPRFDKEMETEWCRVRQLYAGNDYGTFFIPEVGDEVLVAFIQGDMRWPIVLGGLYNAKDKPPSSRQGTTKDEKLIRTKGKNEILMVDSNGDKRIRIKTEAGQTVELEDPGNKITIKTKTGQTITIEPGKITVDAATIVLSGTNVQLGNGAAQSVVLGEALLAAFATHTHICNLPTLPSGPPTPLPPTVLSKISKTA